MLELEQPAPPDSAVADTTPPVDLDNGAPADPPSDEITGDLPEQAPPVDEAEDDIEGVKLKGPKEVLERIKAERLMQADYTRKTQEVADTRRDLEAREAQFAESAKAHQAHIREVAQVVALDEQLAQFANVNWQQLTDQDPVQALKLHTTFTQLQAKRGQLVEGLTQKQQAQQQEQQRTHAKQLMEARQVLERDIKGWSPELAAKLSDFGVKQGFKPEQMQNITMPAVVKLLHKAYLFDQLEQQRAKKPVAAPVPPVSRVSGGSAVTTTKLSETSDAEFVRRRREYISKHR